MDVRIDGGGEVLRSFSKYLFGPSYKLEDPGRRSDCCLFYSVLPPRNQYFPVL